MSAFSHRRPASRPRPGGFTLVELLAAVAVIAVLVSLAVTAVASVRVAAQRAKCSSNLRQIGLAILAYAAEHEQNLPPTTHSSGPAWEAAWIYALRPYLSDVDEVRICPADPRGADRLKGGGTSYILNNIVFDPQYGPFGEPLASFNNLLRIPCPGSTFFAAAIADVRGGAGVQNDHTHAEAWDGGWHAFIRDIEANRHRLGSTDADHTNGSANYLFADGHVENVPAPEMKRRFDAGENFARPPQS